MTITEQYTDMAGKIRMVVLLSTGQSILLKFQTQPTTQQLETIEADYILVHEYDGLTNLTYELLDNIELLREVVTEIKTHPTLNLTQYNNYLAGKEWYEQAIIRYFIFVVALGLAQHYEKNLANLNETTILVNVRDWIVETPAKKIAKILFNN